MAYKLGFVVERHRLIPEKDQRIELKRHGVDVIFDNLPDLIGSIRPDTGDTLYVWDFGVIGQAQFLTTVEAVSKAGGDGIYSINQDLRCNPDHKSAQNILESWQASGSATRKARAEGGSLGGRPRNPAWGQADLIRSLHNNSMTIPDLMKRFKCGEKIIRQILKGQN